MSEDGEQRAQYSNALSSFHQGMATLLSDLDRASSVAEVESLQKPLEEVRRQATEGVEWWTGYDVRQAQESVRRAEAAYDAAWTRVRPRQRFKFWRVVMDDNPEEEAAAAAAAASSAPDSGAVLDATMVKDGMLEAGDMSGRDVTVNDISGARVQIGDVGALRLIGLTGCSVDTGAVGGSVWVSRCARCVVRTKCRQLRVHETTESEFVVDVESGPIIEACQGVRFGRLGGEKWKDVEDFSWLREGHSPNWELME